MDNTMTQPLLPAAAPTSPGAADACSSRRQNEIVDARMQASVVRAAHGCSSALTFSQQVFVARAAQTRQAERTGDEDDAPDPPQKKLKTETTADADIALQEQQRRNEALRFLYKNPIARKTRSPTSAIASATSTGSIADAIDDGYDCAASGSTTREVVDLCGNVGQEHRAISEGEELHPNKNPFIDSILKYISAKQQEAQDLKLALKLQHEEERVDEEAGMASTITGKAFRFVERILELQAQLLLEESAKRSMAQCNENNSGYDSDDDRKPAAVEGNKGSNASGAADGFSVMISKLFDANNDDDANSTAAVMGGVKEPPETFLSFSQIQTVATDDMVFMAEKMFEKQLEFQIRDIIMTEPSEGSASRDEDGVAKALLSPPYLEPRPSNATPLSVDIGVHYTRKANMDRIRTDGLLSRPERNDAGIREDRFTGSAYGEGVYTGNDYLSFSCYGDVGILCARLRGLVSADKYDPDCDTVIPIRGSRGGMVVLRSSSQCIPLVYFPKSLVTEKNSDITDNGKCSEGRKAVYRYHLELQQIVNEFFNSSATTPQLPVMDEVAVHPRQRLFRKMQHVAAPPTTTQLQSSAVGAQTSIQHQPMTAEDSKRKEKEKFLMFVRVLMKYLEKKDGVLHVQAKEIIKECAERNKRHEPGYESVTASMKLRLKKLVGDAKWQRSEVYLKHFLESKRKQTGAVSNGLPSLGQLALPQHLIPHPPLPPPLNQPLALASAVPPLAHAPAAGGTSGGPHLIPPLPTQPGIGCPSGPSSNTFHNPPSASNGASAASGAPAASRARISLRPFRQRSQPPSLDPPQVVHYTAPDSRNLGLTSDAWEEIPVADLNSADGSQIGVGAVCPICLETLNNVEEKKDCAAPLPGTDSTVVRLKTCGHAYHKHCIQMTLQRASPRCPTCRKPVCEPAGKMPSGTMTIHHNPRMSCAGYESHGVLQIRYSFSNGIQKVYHENPGTPYGGTSRVAYLPDSIEGQDLLKRLRYAFSHGLTFTIGTSLTSGRSNVITWASIHHKTELGYPGGRRYNVGSRVSSAHGFPDLGYFFNCNEELDSLGVPIAKDCP